MGLAVSVSISHSLFFAKNLPILLNDCGQSRALGRSEMSNVQFSSQGVTVCRLVIVLSKVRIKSLQLGRVMKSLVDESAIFDLRKH